MTKVFQTVFLAIVTLFLVSCSSSKKTALAEKGLLWEISGNGLTKPSYVYGTIHMIPAGDYFLPNGTLSAIENSKKMYFEIDMKDMSDMSKLMGLMNKIFMKDGLTLKKLLSEEDYTFVSKKLSDMGLPMFMMDRVKPLFLSALGMADMGPNAIKEGKVKSYEMEFYEIAQDKNLPTAGLETIDFQISVFDSIPYTEQAKMLVDGLKKSDTDNDEFKSMVQIYKNQDIKAMSDMMSGGASDFSKHEDLLLGSRNKNWIPLIAASAKKEPTFFAVGAGHLGGVNGVINLLRKEGYKVKSISL
jgi:uncharacterized protein